MRSKNEIIGYYQIERKERVYFAIKIAFSIFFIAAYVIFSLIAPDLIVGIISTYLLQIAIYILLIRFFRAGFIKGYLKNNAVLINKRQLPEINAIVKEYSETLSLKKVPKVFVLESGGQLNAFAARLQTKNYVVIYSDLLEEFYNGNEDTIRFVIAHELGHIKQKHLLKSSLTFPSALVPFLNLAYSRACEYTCDNIGAFFSESGAQKGIVTLAAGKQLNKMINKEEFINQIDIESGFWSWFTERLSTHPNLNKRLQKVYKVKWEKIFVAEKTQKEKKTGVEITQPLVEEVQEKEDHTRYMPKF